MAFITKLFIIKGNVYSFNTVFFNDKEVILLTLFPKSLRLNNIHPLRFFKSILTITGFIIWLGMGITTFYIYQLNQAIPTQASVTYETIRQHAQTLLLSKFKNSNDDNVNAAPLWAELKDINPDLIQAIILSEDPTFFNHKGINYDEFMYALTGVVNGNKKLNATDDSWNLGIGTISQQTANRLYFSSGETSVFTFSVPLTLKIQELITTQRFENNLTKKQILELFLNIIEFGPGLFGIDSASRYYFDKKSSEVNAAEGVYLALLISSPKNYHYTLFNNGNWSPALKKKHQKILRQMYHRNLITNDDYRKYSNWLYRKSDYFKE